MISTDPGFAYGLQRYNRIWEVPPACAINALGVVTGVHHQLTNIYYMDTISHHKRTENTLAMECATMRNNLATAVSSLAQ